MFAAWDEQLAQLDLYLAAVDRGAPTRRVRRVHLVQRSLRCRHVFGRVEELYHDRRSLVRVVENLDSLGGNVHGRSLARLSLGQARGEMIGIDVGESDYACVHDPPFRSLTSRTLR